MAKAKKPYSKIRRNEIHFKVSLLRFSLLFLFTLIVGLSLRLFMQRLPLQQKIQEKIEQPERVSLQMEGVQLQFHNGLWPALGVAIKRLEMTDIKCSSQKFAAQNLFVGLHLPSLFKGRLQPGTLSVEYLDGSLSPNCNEQKTAQKGPEKPLGELPLEEPKRAIASAIRHPALKSLNEKWLADVFSKHLSRLEGVNLRKVRVEHLKLHWIEALDREGTLEGELIVNKSDEISLRFDIDKLQWRGQTLDLLSGDLVVHWSAKAIEAKLQSAVREGRLALRVHVANQDKYPSTIQLESKKVPLSAISSFLNLPAEIHYLWLSCQVEKEAEFSKLNTSEFAAEKCVFDGPYGEVLVKDLRFTLDQVKALEVEVKKLNLDQVVKDKRHFLLSGVLAGFGQLSAQAKYQNHNLDVDGSIEGADFLFSKNSLRELQRVHTLPFTLSRHGDDWKLTVQSARLDDGEIDGRFFVEYDQKNRNAKGQLSVHKLLLKPRIYQLMLKAKPAEMKLYGRFTAQKGQLEDWSAVLASRQLLGENYKFENLKVKANHSDQEVAEVRVTASQGLLSPGSDMVKWMRSTHLAQPWGEKDVEFKEFSTNLMFHKNKKVSWNRGYAHLNNGWQLSSEGEWEPQNHMTAWVQWDKPKGESFMRWSFAGEVFQGRWRPENPWLKNWLTQNASFMEAHPNVEFTQETGNTLREKINNVKDKAIEKAKKLLNNEKKDGGS